MSDDLKFLSGIKFEENDLAKRMSPLPIWKTSKHVLEVPKGYDREKTMNKVRQLTEGRFYFGGRWIQFEDEKDYFSFKVFTLCKDI